MEWWGGRQICSISFRNRFNPFWYVLLVTVFLTLGELTFFYMSWFPCLFNAISTAPNSKDYWEDLKKISPQHNNGTETWAIISSISSLLFPPVSGLLHCPYPGYMSNSRHAIFLLKRLQWVHPRASKIGSIHSLDPLTDVPSPHTAMSCFPLSAHTIFFPIFFSPFIHSFIQWYSKPLLA